MKRNIGKKIALAMGLFFILGAASAQSISSAYFMKGSYYRHQMNPAFQPERGYVSIPGLGNMNVTAVGNVGLENFIFDYKDPKYKSTTFMNPSITPAQFLGQLKEMNRFSVDLKMTLLGFGFKSWGGYNTFGLNLRSTSGVNMPYELFKFAKIGMNSSQGGTYNIKDLEVYSNNYLEMAFGHSRKINERLSVGAKLKVLLGLANATAKIEEMNIVMQNNKWEASMKGKMELAFKGSSFKYGQDTDDNNAPVGDPYVDNVDVEPGGLAGLGLGVDLGVTYDMKGIVDGLSFSAAIIDLGFINWNENIVAENDGSKKFTFDGFENISTTDNNNSGRDLEDQVEDLGDDLKEMARFYDKGKKSRSTGIGATLNVGAEYVLPAYKQLSFGLLSSTHFNRPFTWTEVRASANLSPLKWFEAGVSLGVSTFGTSLGMVMNFHPKGFNFFIASDALFTKINPQFIPLSGFRTGVSFGMNITF